MCSVSGIFSQACQKYCSNFRYLISTLELLVDFFLRFQFSVQSLCLVIFSLNMYCLKYTVILKSTKPLTLKLNVLWVCFCHLLSRFLVFVCVHMVFLLNVPGNFFTKSQALCIKTVNYFRLSVGTDK